MTDTKFKYKHYSTQPFFYYDKTTFASHFIDNLDVEFLRAATLTARRSSRKVHAVLSGKHKMPSAAITNPQLQFTSNDFDFGIIIEIMDDASEPASYLASDNYYDTGISDSQISYLKDYQISYLKDYQISYLTRLPTNIRAVQTFARAALLLQQSIVGLPFVAIYR